METKANRNFRPSSDTPDGNNELIKKAASNNSGSTAGTPTDEFIDAEPNRLPADKNLEENSNSENTATRENDFAKEE